MLTDCLPACCRQMAYGYEEGGLRPGAVTFFPDSAPYWVSTAGLESRRQRGGGEVRGAVAVGSSVRFLSTHLPRESSSAGDSVAEPCD